MSTRPVPLHGVAVRFRTVAAPAMPTREADAPWRRARSIGDESKVSDDGKIRLLASTSDAVDWGGWREILSHAPTAVDTSAARSLLVNHDPDQLAGGIAAFELDGKTMGANATLDPDARMASGVNVKKAVGNGTLRGVSVGYTYRFEDADWNEDTRVLTVRKWRLLEISLTPIPADGRASVRSAPSITPTRAAAPEGANMTFEAWLKARGLDISKLSEADVAKARAIHTAGGELPADFAAYARTAAPTPALAPAAVVAPVATAPSEAQRAAIVAEQGEIARQARSLGLDPAEFVGMTRDGAKDAMLAKLTSGRAAATPAPAVPVVQVVADAGDKLLSRARGALYAAGRIVPEKGSREAQAIDAVGGVRAMSLKALVRSLARADGHFDADDWSDMQLGMFFARHVNLSSVQFASRDASAANKIVAGFSNILANVATKVLETGLSSYNAATWDQWATIRNVPNFLQVTNAGLSSGRLTLTPEGEAFPELLQKDGGYNSQLGLYGATVSLTWQTLVNDQLGAFMDSLRRIGAICGLTIDRLVYSKLLGATWTNDVSATAGLATIANLDKPRAALKAKLSPAGEKLGVVARYLLHDPANALPAQQATGAIYAGGQTTAPSLGTRQIVPVESHWIGDTALTGGALTTDYYLTGDPGVDDTVLVNFLEGVGRSPIILPFDPGAVAAEKYKVMLPVNATAATHVDSAGNTRLSGMQKATVA